MTTSKSGVCVVEFKTKNDITQPLKRTLGGVYMKHSLVLFNIFIINSFFI